MAPPATPSPRRFLPASSSRRQPSPTKSAKPPSRLNQSTIPAPVEPVRVATHAQHIPPPPRTQQHLPPPSGSQFAPTPRFSLARPKPAAAVHQQRQDAASPPRSSLAHALRPPRVREDVEDTASSPSYQEQEGKNDDDDEEMLLTAEPGEVVQPSIENHQFYEREQVNDQAQYEFALPYSPKRRRLDPTSDPDLLLSPGHRARMLKTTITQAKTPNPLPPRFAPPTHPAVPDSTTPISTTMTPSISRPSFLRPPTPPTAPPLPQSFSPHRRRGAAAFVPGGVASTVQAWVVEAGVQRGGAALGRRFRVKVERAEVVVGGSGGWRVWGRRDEGCDSVGGDGERVRCLLVGEGSGNGKGGVSEGAVVGVSRGGLGWEVDVGLDVGLDGEGRGGVWWVGVGWEVGGGGGT